MNEFLYFAFKRNLIPDRGILRFFIVIVFSPKTLRFLNIDRIGVVVLYEKVMEYELCRLQHSPLIVFYIQFLGWDVKYGPLTNRN